MADIKNKNEIRRRIDLFLHEFSSREYEINEEFCKETMRMMAEFIGTANDRLDQYNKMLKTVRAENLKLKEKSYKEVTGLCRGKKLGEKDGKWYIGQIISIGGEAFLIDSYPQKAVKTDQKSEGVLSAKYVELDPDTVQRCTGKTDVRGSVLFEGDIIRSTISKTVIMEICYGRYGAFCPNDQEYMENIGFFVVSNTTGDAMPLGPTNDYADRIGNIIENPGMKIL